MKTEFPRLRRTFAAALRSARAPARHVATLAFALAMSALLLRDVAANGAGQLTDTSGPITFVGGPYRVSNPTPVPEWDTGPECGPNSNQAQTQPCEHYALTVKLPDDWTTRNNGEHAFDSVKVRMDFPASSVGDYDLWGYKGTVTNLDGTETADFSSASTSNPEIATFAVQSSGANCSASGGFRTCTYTVIIVPYNATNDSVTLKIELVPGPTVDPNFGGPDPTVPGAPRYQVFVPPTGSSAETTVGEFNIGFNPRTGRIMAMNLGPVWRLTPAELKPGGGAPAASGKPECCEALWENVSDPRTDTGVDPILVTDGGYIGNGGYVVKSGRTFATNSTAGGVILYTDNDGGDPPANDQPNTAWIQGAQGPNGGVDHESIGSGPLPASQGALANPVNQGEYILYCSQDLVAPTMCQRSLDLGATWENAFAATGINCAGLHGHIRIAPDGTAWLPVNHCGNVQGGSISIDSSITPWTEFAVGGTNDLTGQAFSATSQSNGADPSIALDAASTAYYCYVKSEANGTEGHVHVAVGKRRTGSTTIDWIRDVDVGASHNIRNAAHTEAIGGSAGRAACGFMGTNVPGDYQALDFPGNWYVFIATTYDEGRTWTTINATPNDPVQHFSGVWQQGGGELQRNLLDFNEITVDNKGRVLYGYSDGCVTPGCVAGTSGNDFRADMRVARQSGGKPLLASLDPSEPALPKPPCLSGTRDKAASHLTWKAPDNGGADITRYQVFRGTSPGGETPLGQTLSGKTSFEDNSADQTVPHYYYVVTAFNVIGESVISNELDLQVTGGGTLPKPPDSCNGVNVVTDAAGDSINPSGGGGTTSQGDIVGISFSNTATQIRTTLTIANLTQTPSPGTSFTSYFAVWTSSNGTMYGTEMDVAGAAPSCFWGPWDPVNNQLTAFNTGNPCTLAAGANGTVTVGLPRTGVGSPTIPITDPAATPAVREPYGLTIAGEGVLGTGLVFVQPMDRAPDGGGGQRWAVCLTHVKPVIDAFAATPSGGNPPLTVTFNATATDADTNGDSIVRYSFDFGDGNTADASTGSVTYTYNALGTYNAKVTVLTLYGQVSDPAFTTVTVANAQPPVPNLAATPTSGGRPLNVSFDGSASTDPEGFAITSYTFNFGDGSPAVTQAGATTSHTYTALGSYTASLSVTDSRGVSSAAPATKTIDVVNLAPVAVLTADPTTGDSPLSVSFDGSASSDPDAGDTLVSYTFEFGDGSPPVTQGGATINHAYAGQGTYDATLKVTDSHGLASAPVTLQLVVNPGPPVAQLAISPPGAVPKGDPVTLDGSFSSGDDIADFTFDFGDGSPTLTQAGATTSHVYRLGGGYTVSLSVRDTQDVVRSTTATLNITNTAPVAAVTATPNPSEGQPPFTVSFDASGSYDPDAAKLPGEDFVESYEFDYGDGVVETVSVPTVNHTYTTPGTYEARLNVYDHEGKRSTVQAAWPNIRVLDNAPVAVLGADKTAGFAPLAVTFDGAGSSDPDGGDSVVSYTFDFGDGSDPVTRVGASSVQHVYPTPGSYTATLVVQDSHGAASPPAALAIDVGPVNHAPIARAAADKLSGNAPIQVAFDAGASSDADGDALVEYTFKFGDGTPDDVRNMADYGADAARTTHTYASAGRYPGFVTVKDARGALSSNSDQVTITATTPLGENTTVPAIEDSKGPFSGALAPWTLLGLALLGLGRRIRPRGRQP
jgi:PKD repeat protein